MDLFLKREQICTEFDDGRYILMMFSYARALAASA